MTPKAQALMEKMRVQAKFPYLIEVTYIDNQGTEEILRYANADEDKEFTEIIDGEEVTNTFYASYFVITPPEVNTTGFSDAKITISAIDQTWINRIRSTSKRAKIRFIAVIDYDDNGEVIEPIEDMEFTLTNAQASESTIQFVMKFDDLLSIKVPYDECNEFVCPALV